MIKEQIDKDFLESYKAKDSDKVGILRLLKTALKNTEIAKKEPLSDKDEIALLKKELKTREESASQYEKAGREDLAAKERYEISIIGNYLPEQMSEEETRKIVEEIASSFQPLERSSMGKIIGQVMAKCGDRVDGGAVSRIVNELISKQ